jgi:hypothetical protein
LGSSNARAELRKLANPGQNQVTSIVNDSFAKGLQGVMLLGAGWSFFGVWPAL